jgi:2,3-bisphosphoglycerate-dependent phosphoglycerate mutase
MKIYLARHGETDWNAARRLQGWTDIPLNEKGRGQARKLAEILAATRLDAIYCSMLRRSMETAEILDRRPVIGIIELNEQSLGKYEGVTLNDEELFRFKKLCADARYRLEGGESRSEHLQRIQKALQQIRSAHTQDAQVLIIGHGGTNNLILQELLKTETDLMFRIANHEIFLIDLPHSGNPSLWKYFTIP